MPVIEVDQLVKSYGRVTAVDSLSFSVEKGEIFGLLGPNGAGKTTTLEILEGIQTPSGGKVKVLGIDPVIDPIGVKQRIGIQLQSSAYYEYLTLVELLDLFGSFYDRRNDPLELLKLVNLADKQKAYVTQLSGGQQHRFSIVAALVNRPDIVFLDEPTTGLDPQARRQLWEIVEDIRRRGATVILTTHYMEEAQLLCDRLAIIDAGRIIAEGTPSKLIQQLPNQFRIVYHADQCLGDEILSQLKDIVTQNHEINPTTKRHTCSLGVKRVQDVLIDLIDLLHKKKLPFEDLEVIPSNLDDVFLTLTGRALRD